MKPADAVAITAGTVTGATISESLEQIVASAAAAVAVYLLRSFIEWAKRKLTSDDDDQAG